MLRTLSLAPPPSLRPIAMLAKPSRSPLTVLEELFPFVLTRLELHLGPDLEPASRIRRAASEQSAQACRARSREATGARGSRFLRLRPQ